MGLVAWESDKWAQCFEMSSADFRFAVIVEFIICNKNGGIWSQRINFYELKFGESREERMVATRNLGTFLEFGWKVENQEGLPRYGRSQIN